MPSTQALISPAHHCSLISPVHHCSLISPAHHCSLISPAHHRSLISPAHHCSLISISFCSHNLISKHIQSENFISFLSFRTLLLIVSCLLQVLIIILIKCLNLQGRFKRWLSGSYSNTVLFTPPPIEYPNYQPLR